MSKVFISGNFSVLHPGHIRLFQLARSLGDELIVGVNSDENGVICKLEEKPEKSKLIWANAAIYIFDVLAIQEMQEKYSDAQEITVDILDKFIGRMQAFQIEGFHMDMGTHENLRFVRKKLEKKL